MVPNSSPSVEGGILEREEEGEEGELAPLLDQHLSKVDLLKIPWLLWLSCNRKVRMLLYAETSIKG